jgi:hypothetical protein
VNTSTTLTARRSPSLLRCGSARLGALLVALTALTLTSCSHSYTSFEEPGVRGRIVDADTQQPIAGVVVFGYYATVEGSFGGGERVQDVLRVFEVESDASGVFEIPAWSSGTQLVKGEARNQFPAMGFYKGGYQTVNKRLGSLRQWTPFNLKGAASYTVDGKVYDWRALAHEMKAAKSEKERYTALIDARDSTGYKGECGWEQHVKLLWAQHVEWKEWLKRNLPAEGLNERGYKKSSYQHPDRDLSLSNQSAVDNIFDSFEAKQSTWACRKPAEMFPGAKK